MTGQPDAVNLLGTVASALTACEQAGIPVKLKHGAVITDYGYVLQVDDGWAPRTRAYTEFSPAGDDDLD